MKQISICLFGQFEAQVDGEKVTAFKYAKVRALLAYLAMESHRALPRASLAGLLWPDQPERAARSSLSQALATLRSALGEKMTVESVLLSDAESVHLDPGSIQVDVSQFLDLLHVCETHAHRSWRTCTPCARRLQQAAALYRGNYLADFTIPDSSIFEEWAGLQREHLLQRALSAFQHLSEWQEWRGNFHEAIAATRRQVALEPLLEVNHRQLLRLLALNGEQSAALAHYQQLQNLLDRELGIEPEAETTALFNQIQQDPARQGPFTGQRRQPGFAVPLPPTPLVGRTQDLEELCTKLQDGVRLLTITGAGGIGKTRLALEAAHSLHYDFEDGVFYVELAPLNDANRVGTAIAQVLGEKERPGQDARDTLLSYLRSKHLLLVLDNFEHVDQAATLISDLLADCPGVRFLVTSRKPLNLRAEHPYLLEPLAEADALQLFEQRAQVAGVRITDASDRDRYREICRRLDGLPLAIELFAAHTRVLSAREMLAQIEKPLQFPLRGPRDLPERQQTLRNAIQWSYDLLDPEQQRVFRHLGIFAGGCTVETLQAVVGESPSFFNEASHGVAGASHFESALHLEGLLPALEALQEASLVQVQETTGERRFTMLQTLREFALEQITAQGEADAARQRHAETFLALAERARPESIGRDQKDWFDRLGRELANLRSALSWSQVSALETHLRLATALEFFWIVRGYAMEGRKWLKDALRLYPSAPAEIRADALMVAGILAGNQDNYPEAHALLNESRDLFLQNENEAALARVLYNLGTTAEGQTDYPTALAYFQECLKLARSLQDWYAEASALDGLALIAVRLGDHAQARLHDEQALSLYQTHGDIRHIAMVTSNLGIIATHQGDYQAAREYIETALSAGREFGDHYLTTLSQLNLANIQIAQGDYAAARANLEGSIDRQRVQGDTTGLAAQLGALGRALHKLGEFRAARAAQAEALTIRVGVGDRRGVAVSLENLAPVELSEDQPGRAARLLGAAEAIREAIRAPMTPSRRSEHEQLVPAIRDALGEAAFSEAWAAGRALTEEQAVDLALVPPILRK